MTTHMQCPGPCADVEVCWCLEETETSYGTLTRLMPKLKRKFPHLSEVDAQWEVIEALIEAAFEVADNIYEPDELIRWEKRWDALWHLQREIMRQLGAFTRAELPRKTISHRCRMSQPTRPPATHLCT